MRRPKYLSPSSLMQWEKDPAEFYLQRLVDTPPPRMPQTVPMAIGSAFDAFVKAELGGLDAQTLFDSQVEVTGEDRKHVIEAGTYCMHIYKESGAMACLLQEARWASRPPMYEASLQKEIGLPGGMCVPLLGKPDCAIPLAGDAMLVLDWKVNGYMSTSGASPNKGYVALRELGSAGSAGSAVKRHKSCTSECLGMVEGTDILMNLCVPLEDVNADWALQVCTYAWLFGAEVGATVVAGIDQLACKNLGMGWDVPPKIRVASFRNYISESFQYEVLSRYAGLWEVMGWDDERIKDHLRGRLVDTNGLDVIAQSGGGDTWITGRVR